MTKVTYICRSAKKKVVTYFILFLFLFLFFIDCFLRRFWGRAAIRLVPGERPPLEPLIYLLCGRRPAWA
jgi:hypothetical protein